MAEVKNGLSGIVGGFIGILVGIILIGVVADNISEFDDIVNVVNESLTISVTDTTITNESVTLDGSNQVQITAPVYSVTFFGNITNSTDITGINVGEEVNFTKEGLITVDGGTVFPGSGPYNISYTTKTAGTGTTSVTSGITSLDFFGNATISTHITGIATGAEANLSSTGTARVSTYNFTAGDYNVSYTHEGVNFVASKVSRTLVNLVIIFFALAVLAIAFLVTKNAFPELF